MKIFRYLAITLIATILLSACSADEKQSSPTSTTATSVVNGEKPLHTMYVVGDIDSFNNRLAPLAKQIVKNDPTGTWWILGDAGYGDEQSVTSNYKAIAEVIPAKQLHVIYGDHDYGTQDPTQFKSENKISTGAESILGAQDSFSYLLDNSGALKQTDSDTSKLLQDISWAIAGTNDICVETGNDPGTDCNPDRLTEFDKALSDNSKLSKCSIAMWHHPVFGIIKDGGNDQKAAAEYGTPLFESAINNDVDIVLNGDHHEFVATKNIDIDGKFVADGSSALFTREFIVGTGGAPLSADAKTPRLMPNAIDSEIRNDIGALKIDLYKGKAELKFLTVKGTKYSTSIDC